ncbi:hypothetical protein F4678DRAFT_437312 [Xylaria arbuscula]|nr:hypothetical protein F4678DRAFT_437312 [Xylaria arbuscula]
MSRKKRVGAEAIANAHADTSTEMFTMSSLQPSQIQRLRAPSPSHHPKPKNYEFAQQKLKQLQGYLNNTAWQRLHENQLPQQDIICGNLNLSTAQCTSGKSFLQLMSDRNTERFWHAVNGCKVKGLPEPDRTPTENFFNAKILFNLFQSCLWAYNDDDKPQPFIEGSSWERHKLSSFEFNKLSNLNYGKNQWHVPWLLKIKAQPHHGGLPHINCFLKLEHRLEENFLLFSEVWVILMVTFLVQEWRSHKLSEIVPVTIVSLSYRQVRIVQGYVDGNTRKVMMNKSRILDLEKGQKIDDIWHEVSTITRWFLGTPVDLSRKTA